MPSKDYPFFHVQSKPNFPHHDHRPKGLASAKIKGFQKH